MAAQVIRVKVGDRWYTVEVNDLSTSPVEATINGQTFLVEVEDLPELGASPSPFPPPASAPHPQPSPGRVSQTLQQEDRVMRSPMSAKVLAVRVRPGDRVSQGQEVCVIEAMKMEQSIRASFDGIVKAVHVTPLQQVATDDPLVELE